MLECISWISTIWYELCSSFTNSNCPSIQDSSHIDIPHIPDNVIIDILSRLPVESVIQLVCKQWLSLTKSSFFAQLHLKRGSISTPPSIFLNWLYRSDITEPRNLNWLDFRVYDNQIGGRESVKKVNTQNFFDKIAKYEPIVVGSCDGLLLIINTVKRNRAFVLNPVTQKLVVVRMSFDITIPCGIYCDPSTREYKVVLSNYDDEEYVYHSKVTLKTMECETIMSTMSAKMYVTNHSAVAPNGSLFWIIDQGWDGCFTDNYCKFKISVFCRQHENFHVHLHPGSGRSCCNPYDYMQLLKASDKLWLFNMRERRIQIWVLCDSNCYCDKCSWKLRYVVNLENLSKCNLREFSYFRNHRYTCEPRRVKIVAMRNDVEILICWSSKVMFWYNLKDSSVKRASVSKWNASGNHSVSHLRFCAFNKTFVSIKQNSFIEPWQ